jgi:hypothetical protein
MFCEYLCVCVAWLIWATGGFTDEGHERARQTVWNTPRSIVVGGGCVGFMGARFPGGGPERNWNDGVGEVMNRPVQRWSTPIPKRIPGTLPSPFASPFPLPSLGLVAPRPGREPTHTHTCFQT